QEPPLACLDAPPPYQACATPPSQPITAQYDSLGSHPIDSNFQVSSSIQTDLTNGSEHGNSNPRKLKLKESRTEDYFREPPNANFFEENQNIQDNVADNSTAKNDYSSRVNLHNHDSSNIEPSSVSLKLEELNNSAHFEFNGFSSNQHEMKDRKQPKPSQSITLNKPSGGYKENKAGNTP
uniref:Uncharacterized protein n=1 Tax=Ciona savignyi TaxID=51511 RepID=H2YLA6_CIOSA